jgi:hypothetical protein
MTWKNFYRRRDVIEAVLSLARRDPEAPLPFAEVPGVEEAFGNEENLLLALQYRWTQRLSGYLRTELVGDTDHVDAATRAWHRAVRDNRALRAVLDANLERYPSLGAVRRAEQRTLAVAAGLADPGEPTAASAQVGAAFETLLRHGPRVRPARHPMGQLLRMLAPSG